ncbi:MAG: hypothetical protein M1353_10200 [Nitrospirae bacterium]|nr:hypothetical protein [Nitrospirota bacterium]
MREKVFSSVLIAFMPKRYHQRHLLSIHGAEVVLQETACRQVLCSPLHKTFTAVRKLQAVDNAPEIDRIKLELDCSPNRTNPGNDQIHL